MSRYLNLSCRIRGSRERVSAPFQFYAPSPKQPGLDGAVIYAFHGQVPSSSLSL
jgi:hypothetical protein